MSKDFASNYGLGGGMVDFGDQPLPGSSIPAREVWYVWRVPISLNNEPQRLIIPRSDPHVYEQPADALHATVEDARNWFQEELEAWDEPDEKAYMRTWVLCKETTEVVS